MCNVHIEADNTQSHGNVRGLLENVSESKLLEKAWTISRSLFGNVLSAHIPGLFVVNGRRGGYRAVSITGDNCELKCDHCKGMLLKSMHHVKDGKSLRKLGHEAHSRGDKGILISGGCDREGRLPWHTFLDDIRYLKTHTDLTITVHAGIVDADTARELKAAGIDQALLDIIGDDATASRIFHLRNGIKPIIMTLENLTKVGISTVPHIIFGLHYGEEKGERASLEMLGNYLIEKYVVVVLMPLSGTPMALVKPPQVERVADFLAEARIRYPRLKAALGCARPRGNYKKRLDLLAVKAGVNAIAIPSDEALEYASQRGLTIVTREWCCSLD